jgi:hypothetical protein
MAPRAVLPVGCTDIATRLGVKPQTVMMWVWRTKAGKLDMPSPEWMVSGNPAWQWSTIEEWLRRTGRL